MVEIGQSADVAEQPATGRWWLRSKRILDGTGVPAFEGAVGVEGDRIVAVERGGALPVDAEVVDVGDLAVVPGFVDLHTHSDVSLLSDAGCVSAIVQGITTQVVGLCGFSAGPISAETRDRMVDEEPVFGFPGVAWDWDDIAGYLAAVDAARPATDVLTLVGHNTIRRLVMSGQGEPAGRQQREAIAGHIEDAVAQGAMGFSTGLSYTPGLFADEAELIALTATAARLGVTYHTHMRYGELTVRESLAEALRVAKAADVVMNVSHLYPYPSDPPDEAGKLLEMLEEARAEGLEVTFDLTVFNRGGGAFLQSLPTWARVGGLEGTLACVADPRRRAQLIAFLAEEKGPDHWEDALVVKVNRPENAGLVGRSVADIARERGQPPALTALQLIEEDGQYWVAPTIKRQADLDLLITHPLCVPITDGMAAHPERHQYLGIMPKTFGTFPLVLGSYVRDRGVLPLAEAIEMSTRRAARRAGLSDRGVLDAGYKADLVVLSPEDVANRASEADPAAFPAGIVHVVVAGRFALRDGQVTGDRAGRGLRPRAT